MVVFVKVVFYVLLFFFKSRNVLFCSFVFIFCILRSLIIFYVIGFIFVVCNLFLINLKFYFLYIIIDFI